ncbi:DNA repair protein RecO [Microbacterium amylolyticum]|uniref:DNA repair protein RecO n=1 Tax=Microbacterium amylolyticum TaxID=936337 RepID=A0ABS4ZEF4_9MICO|nr:DNA repair protein RecO [Microbacterium amylolyticum]MBP2435639.1 DNA repair protein RecO (recombination protein O) [Microbacterium amylolyticum]
MPTYRDEAVVLRTHKLGEADRILTMLTRQHGKVRSVAKGVRRTSSKFGARLEPFMVVDAQMYIGRNLDIVQQVVSLGSYGAHISADYDAFLAANVMAETAERLVGEGDPQPQQFFLLVGALRSLARSEHAPRATRDSYLLRALGLSGWTVQVAACAGCGELGAHERFSAQAGGALCERCAPQGTPRPGASVIGLVGSLLAGEWDEIDPMPEQDLGRASALVTAYAQHHLERAVRSFGTTGGAP